MVTALFVSCDKDKNSDEPTPTPTDLVSSIVETYIGDTSYDHNYWSKRYSFQYDESNKLKGILYTHSNSNNSPLLEFFWNPFSMLCDDKKVNVNLSPSGYITSANAYIGTEYYPFEHDIKIDYDSKGHLIRLTYYEPEYLVETIYKWENTLLTEIEVSWSEDDHFGKKVLEIAYGNEQNKTGIWPASFWVFSDFEFTLGENNWCCMLQTGLIGVAPTRLPISVSEKSTSHYQGGDFQNEFSYKITPQLDSEGRLTSETIEEAKCRYNLKYHYQ